MKVAFISPFPTISTLGVRGLSSWLREKGHETIMLHMARPSLEFSDEMEYLLRYPDHALDQLVELCKDCQLIGLTMFTQHFEGSVQMTEYLRKKLPNIPQVWGGIHPTVKPDECIEIADYVCRGEGEDSLLELVKRLETGGDTTNIPGMWARKNGQIFRNPEWPLEQELDVYPPFDYGIEGHYVYLERQEKIVPMDWQLLHDYLDKDDLENKKGSKGEGILYRTLATRGCPLNCTYCCNNAYRKLYPRQKYVRHRSVAHLIKEMIWVKEHMPWVTMVSFEDDSFLAAPIEVIRDFSREYKEKVGLPFRCLHEPLTFNEEKLDLLIECGMEGIQMGIETAAKNTLRMYNRSGLGKKVLDAANALAKAPEKSGKKFFITYDLIIDNPWETDDDVLETLQFVVSLPGHFHLNVFSLVFYPGTEIYERAKREGLITDERKQIYRKTPDIKRQTYISFLLMLLKNDFPRWMLKPMVNPKVVHVLNRSYLHWIYQTMHRTAHMLTWKPTAEPERTGI